MTTRIFCLSPRANSWVKSEWSWIFNYTNPIISSGFLFLTIQHINYVYIINHVSYKYINDKVRNGSASLNVRDNEGMHQKKAE